MHISPWTTNIFPVIPAQAGIQSMIKSNDVGTLTEEILP